MAQPGNTNLLSLMQISIRLVGSNRWYQTIASKIQLELIKFIFEEYHIRKLVLKSRPRLYLTLSQMTHAHVVRLHHHHHLVFASLRPIYLLHLNIRAAFHLFLWKHCCINSFQIAL